MYCVKCDRHTDSEVCPECGSKTVEVAPHAIYWCSDCRIPVIHTPGQNRITCPRCGGEAGYLCADIRPVFPEERLLFELMVGRPLAFKDDSVWAVGSKYYVNGKPNNISVATILATDPNDIRKQLEEYLENYFREYRSYFNNALSQIDSAFLAGDADGVIQGANMITRKLGGTVHYETVDEFVDFLNSDEDDVL